MVELLGENVDIVCKPLVQSIKITKRLELNAVEALRYILQEQYSKYINFGWSNCNKLFKSDIIKNVRYLPDEKMGEDFSFSWKAFLNAKKIAFSGKKTYNYRIHKISVTRSRFDDRHRTLLLVCDRFMDYVKNNNIDLLEEAYYFKVARLKRLISYARKDKNINFVKKYSNELKKIQMQVYKNKNANFKMKFSCFLHANFYILLYARVRLKIFLKDSVVLLTKKFM